MTLISSRRCFLEKIEALELLGGQREVVEKLGLLRLLVERVGEERERLGMALRVAQELRFGDGELHRVLRILVGDALQESTCFIELALLCDGIGRAHAGRQHVIAALNTFVPLDGARPELLLLGDLTEQIAHGVGVPVVQPRTRFM